jgi:hypothetical protein
MSSKITPSSAAMKIVVDAMSPALKERGYRKRGKAFNRAVDAGLVHVVAFQMGAFNPPGTQEIPRLRPNLYGSFTINLGIYLHEIASLDHRATGSDLPSFVNDYNCQIRTRIGNLFPDPADTWWWLDKPSDLVCAAVTSAMLDYGFPWLAQHATREEILQRLEGSPDPANYAGFMSPPRLTAMRIRLARGEHERARQDFLEHLISYARTRRNPGHLDVLARLARENDFDIDVIAIAEQART